MIHDKLRASRRPERACWRPDDEGRMSRADARMSSPVPLQTDVQRAIEVKGRGLRRVLRWLAFLALLAAAGFGVKRVLEARAKAAEIQWVTEPVRLADLRVTVSATGKLQGLNTVEVGAEVTGKVLRV